MEEKYTFTDLNLELVTDYRYYSNDNESHLCLSFHSCSPYEVVPNLENLDGTRFKAKYSESILKFCGGKTFTYRICYPNSPTGSNMVDIKVGYDTDIDLERFTNVVNGLLKVQYQYLSKQNLIKRKAFNSTCLVNSINNDVLKRGVSGFDPKHKDFGTVELKSADEYDLDWVKIPTNVRAVQLTPNSILIYFGRYARVDRTDVDGVSYVELTYDEVNDELRMLIDKQAKPTKKTSKSKSKKSKSKEVDHDN